MWDVFGSTKSKQQIPSNDIETVFQKVNNESKIGANKIDTFGAHSVEDKGAEKEGKLSNMCQVINQSIY